MLGSKHHVCESHTVLHMYTPESTPSALQQCAAPSYTLPRKPHNLIFIHISNYMYVFLYIYICLCVCVCVVSPLPETYLFGTRPRVQAQKTFFDIRPNSTHVRPQRICLVPLLSSPVPTHAYLSIFHPSISSHHNEICSIKARWPLAFGLAAGSAMPHLGRCGGGGAAGALDMFRWFNQEKRCFLPALAGDFTCFTGKKGTSPMHLIREI